MSEENIIELSHIAFVVLGLVAEHPCHGKNINKRIEDRGMRNWTAIGKSSIYGVLKTLKKKGLVDSWVEEEDNRIVKIYQITNKGTEILKNKVYNVLNEFIGRNDPNFYVAFQDLPYLTYDEQIEVFSNSLNKIRTHKIELEEMLSKIPHVPLNVIGLFIHPIKILQTDIEFIEWVLEEIKKGGGQVDPKAYGK
ncbi:MAG: PadR family transcriptional regulator [Promethearchaeota archaeon]